MPRRDRGPDPDPEVQRALQPFAVISALAGGAFVAAAGLVVLVPLWWAQSQGWTGGGVVGLGLLAPAMFLLLVWASLVGVRMQLRPLAQVASALRPRFPGELRVRGRLRRGWGVSIEFGVPPGTREGHGEAHGEGTHGEGPAGAAAGPAGAVRLVAARGQRARPDLYLVRGEREYRFRDVRRPLPEVEEALRAVGLA